MLRPHHWRGHWSTAQWGPTRRAFWWVCEGVQTQLLKWESFGIIFMLLTCQSKTTRWEIKAMEQLLLHQKQIAITSKQWGGLSWLLIWTGILTHLQVEAPESSLSTAEDDLTLDAQTYIYVCSPRLKEFLLSSFWQPNNNQPIFFFPGWRYVPGT